MIRANINSLWGGDHYVDFWTKYKIVNQNLNTRNEQISRGPIKSLFQEMAWEAGACRRLVNGDRSFTEISHQIDRHGRSNEMGILATAHYHQQVINK